jgi:hypothetical protein
MSSQVVAPREVVRMSGGVGALVRSLVVLDIVAALFVFPSVAGAANPTKLSMSCTPKALSPGVPTTCNASVTDAGPVATRVPPGGTVTFEVDGVGVVDPPEGCILEELAAFSSRCTVSYTPTDIAGGTHRLLGIYGGDDGHGRATAQFTLEVTPANDELDNATVVPVPAKVTGTTEGATWNYEDDPELCSDAYAPVWYAVKPAQSGRIAVRLTVAGRVDSVVAVFHQERSTLSDLGCELSDQSGVAGVPFDAVRGQTYLIAVAAPWDARSGGFTLETATVPLVKLPGSPLTHDADAKLDPLLRPGIAYSVRLAEGVTYRFAAAARTACVHVALLEPSARSEDEAIQRSQGCSGYLVFTPDKGMGGSFPLVVSIPEGHADTVHVAMRRAARDDLTPGLPIRNGRSRAGRLSARDADVVDIFRFSVPSTGDATLKRRGDVHADLLVLDDTGRELACACNGRTSATIVKRLGRGTYYAVVRGIPDASGRYVLSYRRRTPTRTSLRLTPSPGSRGLSTLATISPKSAKGRLVFELQRFDPLTGWHFTRATTRKTSRAVARVTIAPRIGSWRARVRYAGTLTWSPSVSGWIAYSIEPTATTESGRGSKAGRPAACTPGSTASFTASGMTVRCRAAGAFGATTPGAGASNAISLLAKLRQQVESLDTLKDPFRSNLLHDLDVARNALPRNPDTAIESLDAFIAGLQATELRAQLSAEERDALTSAAKRIKAALNTT